MLRWLLVAFVIAFLMFYRLIRVDRNIRVSTALLASFGLALASPMILVLIILEAIKTIKSVFDIDDTTNLR